MATALHALPRVQELACKSTEHNTVAVRRTGERVDLEVEGATFATWHPRLVLTGYSWDALSVGCLLKAGTAPSSVLVLGFGGGTVTRQLRALLPGARLVGVEIDAGIVQLAREHMDIDAQRVELVVEDAYTYLARTTDKFDAIVDDLFLTGAHDVVRSRTPSGHTLDLLRARLSDDGVVVANLITDEGEHKTVRQAARAAFIDAFHSVRVVSPPRGLNEILVGGTRTKPRSSLDAFVHMLPEASDRQRFNELTVQPLRRRR